MRKQIYLQAIKCCYQNINVNRIGKKMISKNKNYITIETVFTENTIEGLHNCERAMKKIGFEIRKKHKKEIKITIEEIIHSIPVGMSNDIY